VSDKDVFHCAQIQNLLFMIVWLEIHRNSCCFVWIENIKWIFIKVQKFNG